MRQSPYTDERRRMKLMPSLETYLEHADGCAQSIMNQWNQIHWAGNASSHRIALWALVELIIGGEATVPGAFGLLQGPGPLNYALISQPELKGVGEKRPDFLWIAFDSATIYPVLIEI